MCHEVFRHDFWYVTSHYFRIRSRHSGENSTSDGFLHAVVCLMVITREVLIRRVPRNTKMRKFIFLVLVVQFIEPGLKGNIPYKFTNRMDYEASHKTVACVCKLLHILDVKQGRTIYFHSKKKYRWFY